MPQWFQADRGGQIGADKQKTEGRHENKLVLQRQKIENEASLTSVVIEEHEDIEKIMDHHYCLYEV